MSLADGYTGNKIAVLLEELKAVYGTQYVARPVNIFEGEQNQEWFSKLSPNGRIPILIDHDNGGFQLMEGQAIVQYLVRKYDRDFKFSFKDEKEQSRCEQWIGFVQSHVYPYMSEAIFFLRYAKERDLFAYHHYVEEVERLYGVLNTRLDGRDFLVGDKYSFADMVAFVAVDVGPVAGIDRSRFPNVYRWWKSIGSRPAVQAGSSVPFALPLIGQAYLQRLKDEPQFKKEEDEILDFVKKAKQQYGAGAHT